MIVLQELLDEKATRLHMVGSFRLCQEEWMKPANRRANKEKIRKS